MKNTMHVVVISVSAAMYTAFFFLPTYYSAELSLSNRQGYNVVASLAFETPSPFRLWACAALIPNCFYLVGMAAYVTRSYRVGAVIALAGFIWGAVEIPLSDYVFDDDSSDVFLSVGFYAWTISMLLLALVSWRKIRQGAE